MKRSQSYGGRHEIGQSPRSKNTPLLLPCRIPDKTISWTSEYSEDIGRANFNLLALHIFNGTPYIVAAPNLCLSYNKWGRPNPPYVFFKYDGKAWQRIPLSEFPVEFKTINLIINNGREEYIKKLAGELGHVPAEGIRKINSSLSQPEYKTILREPLAKKMACGEMIRTKDGWLGIDWFSNQPTYEACMKVCEREKVSPQNCPCETIFNKNKREITMTTQYEIDLALMAGRAYTINPRRYQLVSRARWLDRISTQGRCSGFEASPFNGPDLAHSTEIVISYAGTYDKDYLGDWAADAGLATGFGSVQLRQAAEYYLQVKAAKLPTPMPTSPSPAIPWAAGWRLWWGCSLALRPLPLTRRRSPTRRKRICSPRMWRRI